jgi:hypothetical protein
MELAFHKQHRTQRSSLLSDRNIMKLTASAFVLAAIAAAPSAGAFSVPSSARSIAFRTASKSALCSSVDDEVAALRAAAAKAREEADKLAEVRSIVGEPFQNLPVRHDVFD